MKKVVLEFLYTKNDLLREYSVWYKRIDHNIGVEDCMENITTLTDYDNMLVVCVENHKSGQKDFRIIVQPMELLLFTIDYFIKIKE